MLILGFCTFSSTSLIPPVVDLMPAHVPVTCWHSLSEFSSLSPDSPLPFPVRLHFCLNSQSPSYTYLSVILESLLLLELFSSTVRLQYIIARALNLHIANNSTLQNFCFTHPHSDRHLTSLQLFLPQSWQRIFNPLILLPLPALHPLHEITP